MSTNKSIAKSTGIIGLATLCSRILGFIRDILVARLFGVYVYAQAFVIAFKIPNLFRDIVGEGAANAALVPVFSEYSSRHTKEEFWELANVVLNLLLVFLTVLTIAGIVFAPFVVRILAPGFCADPYKLHTTIKLTQFIFPYILLISLSVYATAILNSLKYFTIPAFAPCLLNISIIVFALLFGEGTKGLALGVLVGGVLQLVVQIPIVLKKGFRFNLFKRFSHPGATRIGKLMVPRLLSTSIYQLNNFVDSIFGSLSAFVGEGGVAVLYFANRLIQFPLGIISTSLTQAILPTLSTQVLQDSQEQLRKTFSWGLRTILFTMIPASIGLMVFSDVIVRSLFAGGKFDVYASAQTSRVLWFYSLGLWAYAVNKLTATCFFALKDTVTPTKVSAFNLMMNIVLNCILMVPLGISGIALATSLSGISATLVLLRQLQRKTKILELRHIAISALRIVGASLAMALVCWVLIPYFPLNVGLMFRLIQIMFLIGIGVIAYIGFCFIFGVSEIKALFVWIKGNKKTI